jgi:hypothetical protein
VAEAGGDIPAKLRGEHAEVTALNEAQVRGLSPSRMAVSRPICPRCQATIEGSGGTLTSSTTATWSH